MHTFKTVSCKSLLLLLACAALTFLWTTPAKAVTVDATEFRLLARINAYRASKGRGALIMDKKLSTAATWMARDMAYYGYFGHTDSKGRNITRRLRAFGYPRSASTGENIAAGSSRVVFTFRSWKRSAIHRKLMLKGGFKAVGISRHYRKGSKYHWYWVVDFGSVIRVPITQQ